MTDHEPLPSWVAGPDGRREPFDEDRVSRALFAATERAGRPDPFLARELADGVLHFLAVDGGTDAIAASELHDVIVKVVRELGHPALAHLLGEASPVPPFVGDLPATDIPPDLQAAQREGLLHVLERDDATRLAGVVLRSQLVGQRAVFEPLAAAAERASQFVAIDSPDHLLPTAAAAVEWAIELRRSVEISGPTVFVNLNCMDPPITVATAPGGPLFGPPGAAEHSKRREVTDALLDALLGSTGSRVPVCWHLSEADADQSRLERAAALAAAGAPITFTVDRPRQPVILTTELDRAHPAILAYVGVGLPRLLHIVRESGDASLREALLKRVGSLARLALGAARHRRGVLRRGGRPDVAEEFLLDRARLVVCPVGLGEVVQAVTGQSPTSAAAIQFTRDLLLGLNAALLAEKARLPAVIDTPPDIGPAGHDEPSAGTPRQQLAAAATIQTAMGSGTAVIHLPLNDFGRTGVVAGLLAEAVSIPGVRSFRLIAPDRTTGQLAALL